MGFQAGIIYLPNHLMVLQEFSQLLSILVLFFNPQMQCLQTSFQQVADARVQTASKVTCRFPYLLYMFFCADHCSCSDVMMTIEILGGAVDQDIHPPVYGILIHRRGKCIVNNGKYVL